MDKDKIARELLNKILKVLDVDDLNINSRGLLEGYIRAALTPKAEQQPHALTMEEWNLIWQEAYNKSRGANVFNNIPSFQKVITEALLKSGAVREGE